MRVAHFNKSQILANRLFSQGKSCLPAQRNGAPSRTRTCNRRIRRRIFWIQQRISAHRYARLTCDYVLVRYAAILCVVTILRPIIGMLRRLPERRNRYDQPNEKRRPRRGDEDRDPGVQPREREQPRLGAERGAGQGDRRHDRGAIPCGTHNAAGQAQRRRQGT